MSGIQNASLVVVTNGGATSSAGCIFIIAALVAGLGFLSSWLRHPLPPPPIPSDAEVIAAVAKQPDCDPDRMYHIGGLQWPGPEDPHFYIKYGHGFQEDSQEEHYTRGYFLAAEARNQEYIFHALQRRNHGSIFRAFQCRQPWNKKWQIRVPRIHRAFRHCDTFYIIMEYVKGKPFWQLGGLEPQPLPREDPSFIARWDERYRKLAHAIDVLLTIPAPDARPGPAGGGIIRHPLFHRERKAPVFMILSMTWARYQPDM
ncbi:MAG: hypothetical protein M1829_003786 [Trizodia sp. TS-e1964]|nr:MAG: hypothetical protein M1829_003786 [Trizodia sp. TS-e1964]